MKQIQRQFLVIVLLMGFGIGPAKAQFSSDFQTNTLSGVTNVWIGNYFIGSNTYANALVIRSAGSLNTADGYVGYLAGSSSNSVSVSGAGSSWTNGNLFLGMSGSGNSMVISNAGRVVGSSSSYIGRESSSSSNLALVIGTNSIWNIGGELMVGNNGSGNRLIITNGGRVLNGSGELGDNPGSSGNTALVTGPGSSWTNTASLSIGRAGDNNRLLVNKGAYLYSFYANVGTFGSSNSVMISDTNTVWDDSGETSTMNIGMTGSDNSIVVTNGGKILGYFVYLGRFGGVRNSVLVTGPGSTYSLNCHFYVGNQGNDNWFTAANGATIRDKFCYISYEAPSSNNAVLLSGTNTTWNNEYSVFVGFSGDAGSLTLSNGATMTCGGAFGTSHDAALGVDPTSSSNRVQVTGPGSLLNPADNMYVGLNGPANTLAIRNGGRVVCVKGYVGSNPGSDFNSALVTGANSVWSNSSDFYVGLFPSGNSLVISNGGRVISQNGYVARNSSSSSNSVIITGAGSVWSNSAYLYAGSFGSANSLVISNGGRVLADRSLIGYFNDANNNQALVTGAGSVLSNITATIVGHYGSNNTLVISNGGLVTDFWGLIGGEDSSSDNFVYVEPGGTWRTQRLRVGDFGSHNALFVNGGSVFAGTSMDVGYDPIYPNNLCQLNSGEINVTNASHTAVLEVYGGSFALLGGTLRVDTLIITNIGAQFMAIDGTLSYRSLQLTPGYDADVDGIPNGWEQARGLSPLNPLDAEDDYDGDKMSNLQEFLAGTNPTNASSRLTISAVTLTNGHVRVNWQAIGGKSYVVQTRTDADTDFTDASPIITVPGSVETTTNYLDPATINGQARFYRVRLQ